MKRMELIFADLHKTNPPNPRHQRSINGNTNCNWNADR